MKHRWWIGCLGALACAWGLALGCQGGAETEGEDVGVRVAPLTEKDLLEKLADASENEEIEVSGATPKDIEKALDDLDKRLKPADTEGKRIKADESFYNALTSKQKRGVDRLVAAYKEKADQGEVKGERDAQGKLRPEAKGPKKGNGQGPPNVRPNIHELGADLDPSLSPQHSISPGSWSYSRDTRWWGVKISVNHNFCHYLCSYTTWFLGVLPLPTWVESVIRLVACTPHNRDTDSNGCSLSITWIGAFSASC